MSSKNSSDSQKESKNNSNLKSTIVHKPFATGTINIFNPHRHKSNKSNNQLRAPKLFLNAQLEKSDELETELISELEYTEFEYKEQNWLDNLLSPWSISAIAVIFLANLISGAFIWRNYRLATNTKAVEPLATLGSANLATEEFMPLNLSTLSMLDPAEDMTVEDSPVIEPISPALAPINSAIALSSTNSPYYYILTEYTGDRSLALARQKVKQVSLVNLTQGVFIYLGAFTDHEQAKEFVSQLKEENFAPQIYPFN
ncbi:MAG: hypothetical protein WBM86_10770 [Waterburya sp.]